MILPILLAMLTLASEAWATVRYADNTLVSNCTSGNYSISSRNCTGTDGDAYSTFAAVISPTVAGDTIYIRGGAWTERMDFQSPVSKTGTADAWITVTGYPGETVTIQCTDAGTNSYGCVKARGSRGYFIFQDFIIDGVNLGLGTGWQIRDGNHDFIIRRVEIKNQHFNGIFIQGDNITVEDSYFHDAISDCVPGNRWLGLYAHHGSNLIFRRNKVVNMPGGGGQVYPGPWTDVILSNNLIAANGTCTTTAIGGWVVSSDSTGGNQTGIQIYDNIIYGNGPNGTGGNGGGIRIDASGGFTVTGSLIYNNTIYNNQANSGSAYGVSIGSGAVDTEVVNNLITGNETGQITNFGTNTTISYNACKSSDSCGSTGKATITNIDSCVVDSANGDFRLRTGTNPCRDAGTSVSTRPSPVGTTDIGAFEQGSASSAIVVSGSIELTINAMTPSITPATNITGLTVACVGCTGTPVVSSAVLKTGSTNIVLLTITGISGSGSCTISLGTTNLADSGWVGLTSDAISQGINTVSGLAVSGACTNTGAGSPPSITVAHYNFNASNATDDSGNGNNGTVSSGITFATGFGGLSATIPADTTFRHITTPYGSGINPATQSLAKCVLVLPDMQYSQKIVFSAGGNGTSQRWYAGWFTVNGQQQWGIGIQGSGFTTGSEFPVAAEWTLVCLRSNATTDTATLSVNRVIGTGAGTSVKTYTSYTLVDNLRTGNDGTFTVNNGGFIVDQDWTWNTYPSDADIQNLYDSLFPAGQSVSCYTQGAFQAEGVYLVNGSPELRTQNVDGSINVVANGAVAFKVDVKCIGSTGTPVAVRLYYSTDGVNFLLPVPQMLGTDNVAVWGSSLEASLNKGIPEGCVDATGLTPHDGMTVLDSVASPTITLSQNHCTSFRTIIKVGNIAGQTVQFRWHQDNGAVLGGAYPASIPTIRVINAQAGAGF